MTASEQRARLIGIIRERSYGTGVKITLASGRTSDFYFNLKPTMLHPEGAHLIGELIVAALEGSNVDMIGGLEMGAVPLATAVAAASHRHGHDMAAFFVRKAVKAHGTQSLIEGLKKGETIRGRRVVVLEDVTTTGGSALKAITVLKDEGAIVDRVITVVDRQEGAAEAFKDAGVRFEPLLTRADFL